MMNRRLFAALSLFWIATTHAAECCTIPVFRFALDRWEPDHFKLLLPAEVAAKPEVVELLRPLRAGGKANLDIVTDRTGQAKETTLFFPREGTPAMWSGELNAASLASLLDSKGREQILKRILEGDSVTWVLVDGGTPTDEEAAQRITKRLAFLEQAAALPVQDPDDPDSQLGPGPELKLKFQVMRLRQDEPAEKPLIAMLAGPEGRVDASKPFAAAIFGRGRVLGAWQLDQLDDAGLEDACMFLIGRCSCRVKNENPGWDLLMNVDWPKTLEATQQARKSHTKVEKAPKAAGVPGVSNESMVPETAKVAAEPLPVTSGTEGTPWMLWGGAGLLGLAVIVLLRKS
jgi:LPXTG-motif cell wall-anchored protein